MMTPYETHSMVQKSKLASIPNYQKIVLNPGKPAN